MTQNSCIKNNKPQKKKNTHLTFHINIKTLKSHTLKIFFSLQKSQLFSLIIKK